MRVWIHHFENRKHKEINVYITETGVVLDQIQHVRIKVIGENFKKEILVPLKEGPYFAQIVSNFQKIEKVLNGRGKRISKQINKYLKTQK